MASRRLPSLDVVANLVEYPAVAKNNARFRLQVMANHSRQNITDLVDRLKIAVAEAETQYRPYEGLAASQGAELAPPVGE